MNEKELLDQLEAAFDGAEPCSLQRAAAAASKKIMLDFFGEMRPYDPIFPKRHHNDPFEGTEQFKRHILSNTLAELQDESKVLKEEYVGGFLEVILLPWEYLERLEVDEDERVRLMLHFLIELKKSVTQKQR